MGALRVRVQGFQFPQITQNYHWIPGQAWQNQTCLKWFETVPYRTTKKPNHRRYAVRFLPDWMQWLCRRKVGVKIEVTVNPRKITPHLLFTGPPKPRTRDCCPLAPLALHGGGASMGPVLATTTMDSVHQASRLVPMETFVYLDPRLRTGMLLPYGECDPRNKS